MTKSKMHITCRTGDMAKAQGPVPSTSFKLTVSHLKSSNGIKKDYADPCIDHKM
jgi:hypothetical protein